MLVVVRRRRVREENSDVARPGLAGEREPRLSVPVPVPIVGGWSRFLFFFFWSFSLSPSLDGWLGVTVTVGQDIPVWVSVVLKV